MAASFAKALVQIRQAKVHDESWDSGWVFDIKTDATPAAGGNPSDAHAPACGAKRPGPERRSIKEPATAEDFP